MPMTEYFHVAYLATYPGCNDDDAGPEKLVSVRFLAPGADEALAMAKAKVPHVIASCTDAKSGITAEHVEIKVRSWAEWGATLDSNWAALCNVNPDEP